MVGLSLGTKEKLLNAKHSRSRLVKTTSDTSSYLWKAVLSWCCSPADQAGQSAPMPSAKKLRRLRRDWRKSDPSRPDSPKHERRVQPISTGNITLLMRCFKPSSCAGLRVFTPANFREAPDCAGRRKLHMLPRGMPAGSLACSLVKVC